MKRVDSVLVPPDHCKKHKCVHTCQSFGFNAASCLLTGVPERHRGRALRWRQELVPQEYQVSTLKTKITLGVRANVYAAKKTAHDFFL